MVRGGKDGRRQWVEGLLGAKIQEKATSIRTPTPIPKVPAAPIVPKSALLQKPPKNRATAARVLWSRDATF
jgi:hypothetical protein